MMAPGAFLAMLLAGCGDLFTDPAPPEPASLAVSFTIANAAGADLATAYDKADRVSIRVARQGSVILEETRDFTPAAETRITISLDDVQGAEAVSVALELMLGAAPLFRGSTQVTLAPGAVTPAQLALVPVPAGVRVDPVPELTSLGETAVLSATALFATGDPLPGALLDWVSSNPAVAEVSSGGVVTARGEGSAEVRAAHEGLAGTVSVSVRQAVAGLTLLPPTATLGIDQAMAFAVEPRDARAHPIHGRSVNWATSHPSIASISSAGVATGLAEGTASVIASVDGHLVVGSVSVRRIARIVLSTAAVEFDMVAGGAIPVGRRVTVDNGEAGLLSRLTLGAVRYGAGASGWLTANLTAGTAPAELTLSVSGAQIPPGTYTATVAVESPVALNSPAEVAVTLTVAPPPLLAVGLSQLGFSATAGGQDPAVQSIAVVNAGGGVITDMGLGTVEYGGGASGWLHATLSGSTAPATLTVSAATGALPPGTYTAKLPLRSAALGQEKLIGVSFTVAPGAIIHLSPAGLTFAAVAGHPNPPARTVNVTNAGLSTLTGLGVSIDYGAGASGWLTANLSSTSAPATLTISAAAGQLPPGSYSAQVILSSPVAANAAQVLNVAFQVTAPPLIVLETGQIEILFVPDWEVPEYPQRRVSISNGGGGTLSDLSVGTIEYGPGAAGWLDAWIDEEGGAALVLQVVPADFHAGVYSATVQVESPSAANSPEYVEVILTLIGLPEAETGAASGITQQSAVVEATVLANAPATAVWIEWGTDEQELSNASASLTISFDEDPSNIIFALNGLVPGTRYYYQAVAENEAGEARGDIRDFMTLLPPPVSFWQADGDYSDSSGPNHGSPTENVYFSPDGFKGSAFEFHGDWSPGAVTAPGVGIDDASAFTLSVWVNLSHDAGSSSVLRFITLGNEKAVLRMDGYYENFGALPNALHFYVFTDGGGGGIRTEPLLNQRECYYHVAGTFDGALLRLYLDGVEVGSVASAGGASIAGNGVRLSSNDFEGMFGLLDEVGIYDRALSADAIRSLYEAPGSGQRCGVPE